jgi:predicted DNA-binding transcriptional regulator AlpA
MALGELRATEADEPCLIAADALARLLDISTRGLWRLRSAGKLPKPVRLGGSVRWRLDEIRKWISDGCPAVQARENDTRRK